VCSSDLALEPITRPANCARAVIYFRKTSAIEKGYKSAEFGCLSGFRGRMAAPLME